VLKHARFITDKTSCRERPMLLYCCLNDVSVKCVRHGVTERTTHMTGLDVLLISWSSSFI